MVSRFEHVQFVFHSEYKPNKTRIKSFKQRKTRTARNIALYIDNDACNDGKESLNE